MPHSEMCLNRERQIKRANNSSPSPYLQNYHRLLSGFVRNEPSQAELLLAMLLLLAALYISSSNNANSLQRVDRAKDVTDEEPASGSSSQMHRNRASVEGSMWHHGFFLRLNGDNKKWFKAKEEEHHLLLSMAIKWDKIRKFLEILVLELQKRTTRSSSSLPKS